MADATLENQVIIIGLLHSIQAALTGAGSVRIDHDFGSTDALRIVDGNGDGIDGVWIRAFLKSDYDAGRKSEDYCVATTQTTVTGRWLRPLYLDPATYTLVAFKENSYGPNASEITVEDQS